MKLRVDYKNLDRKILLPRRFAELVIQVEIYEKIKLGEICIIFVGREKILEINKAYLKHNFYTDVITFDNSVKGKVSGDLFICIHEIVDNAKRFRAIKEEELIRVMMHGILHLAGYGDKSENDSKVMREREEFYLEIARRFDLFKDYEFKL